MNKTKKILIALQEHLNLKDFKELAVHLEISATLLYSWVRHDKIARTGKILAKLPYINLQWLETGEGPMAIIDKDNIHMIPTSKFAEASTEPPLVAPSKIAARIEPGKKEAKNSLREERARAATANEIAEDGDLSTKDLLVMTEKVLDSKTVYRSALASNVRAFHQAVIKEEEMMAKDERLERMEAELSDIKSLLVRVLGEQQKRDSAA